jgi:LacI family transcriptional regulator, repressor for deo operon, udp, cdd, tsx, nupC, and nupG
MMKKTTQKDVARLAGVSVATVSYILNNLDGGNIRISEETRTRVLNAIKELQYSPNLNARGLSTQRTQLLAILIPDLTDSFFAHAIRGVQSIVTQMGYDLLVYDCEWRPDRENDFVKAIHRRRVDGIILFSIYTSRASLEQLLSDGYKVVVVGNNPELQIPYGDLDTVGDNEYESVCQVIKYLVNIGHRRIAHITGPMDAISAEARLRGYRSGLLSAALPYDEQLIRYNTSFHRVGVEQWVMDLFFGEVQPRPTALFAANDHIALEAIRVLQMNGLRVPRDVAVVGFDDVPEASLYVPALTTVSHSAQKLGAAAAELLLDRMEAGVPIPARNRNIVCELVIREST